MHGATTGVNISYNTCDYYGLGSMSQSYCGKGEGKKHTETEQPLSEVSEIEGH